MATYFMYGKYSPEAVKKISVKRTTETEKIIRKFGGEVVSMYALLGKYDIVLIVNVPGVEEVMKVSIALSKLTGMSFATFPAVAVAQFDKLTEGV